MSLKITMLKAPASVNLAAAPLSIDEQGGTLGRGAENTWALEDPELFLSSLHCQFSFENGQYFLIDQSTNGTFYAGSADPMGKGSKLPVKNNDRFVIGDYEFAIAVDEQAASFSPNPFADPGSAPIPQDDAFFSPASSDGLDGFASNPFAAVNSSNKDPLISAESGNADPLAALDKARGGPIPEAPLVTPSAAHDPFSAPTHSDGANSMNQQIEWPQPAAQPGQAPAGAIPGAIPDDWDDDLSASAPVNAPPPVQPGRASLPLTEPRGVAPPPVAAPVPEVNLQQQALEQANAKLQAELDALKQQISSTPNTSGNSNGVDTTFIEALGFGARNLSDDEIAQINQLAGEVLREMMQGLMQVLGSRSAIKSEFRMNVTTIQPVENNPLKFSANVDDALENMFLKQGNAFKKPIEAVQEGFEGVAEHQVAILAGIREAFKAVIERFDPITLEERFSKQSKGGLLPGSQKAKNWEAFVDYYQDLAGDIDQSFQYLFGDGFVRAYEDQLQKLAIARKSNRLSNEN